MSYLEKIIVCTIAIIVCIVMTKNEIEKKGEWLAHVSNDYGAGGMSGQPDTVPTWRVWTVGGGVEKLSLAVALT